MEIRLKPCPFCGGEAKIISTRIYSDSARRIGCTKCQAVTQAVLIDHPKYNGRNLDESTRYTAEQAEEKAAEKWNSRADSEQN